MYYPFEPLEKRKKLREFDIQIDSLRDLAANKMHAAFQRSEPKDVYDLYCIVRKGKFVFLGLFDSVSRKFGGEIDPVAFAAKVLESFLKIEKIRPLLFRKADLEIPEIENFFRNEAFSYLKKKI